MVLATIVIPKSLLFPVIMKNMVNTVALTIYLIGFKNLSKDKSVFISNINEELFFLRIKTKKGNQNSK